MLSGLRWEYPWPKVEGQAMSRVPIFRTLSHTQTLQVSSVHPESFLLIQGSKAREYIFQFWKLLAVMVDTHIKCVYKVHKSNDP